MKLILIALLTLSLPAFADEPTPSPEPAANMVTMPLAVVANVLSVLQSIAILHPDLATPAVDAAFAKMTACVNANHGVVTPGVQQCPEVTAALAAAKPAQDPKAKPAKK